MSLEEFDLLEIPVLGCLQVAHVRHRRSNQGADTFGVPINSVIITALAAIAGSLVGAFGSAVGTWITARHQDRRDLLGKQIARREALYSAFLGAELRPPAKACEEYSAMGHTRFAPIALRTNATFIMLKNAKKSRA